VITEGHHPGLDTEALGFLDSLFYDNLVTRMHSIKEATCDGRALDKLRVGVKKDFQR
jgi:hypothetical protein